MVRHPQIDSWAENQKKKWNGQALRREIGPLFRDVTTAAKTAHQPRCDVRVELEHSAWRAEELASAWTSSEIRTISQQTTIGA
jgi:hypothetical protein